MPDFIEISSKSNPLIKLVTELISSSKTRKTSRKFVLEGLRLCKDAFENNVVFDKLLISKSALEKYADDIKGFAKISNETYILTDQLFNKISDTETPQGIIVIANSIVCQENIFNNGKYIALENLQDPSNLGAISRTAEALGINGIIFSGGCDPYNPKSLRASMGALLRMPLYFTNDIIELCNNFNLKTYACVVDNKATSITDITDFTGSAIIIGNEANGISEKTKLLSNESITIKMSGKVESLNAAAAAAIAMWEMVK